jgi:hypothetical protein
MSDGWGFGSAVDAAPVRNAETDIGFPDRGSAMMSGPLSGSSRPGEQEILRLFLAVARTRRKLDARGARPQAEFVRGRHT